MDTSCTGFPISNRRKPMQTKSACMFDRHILPGSLEIEDPEILREIYEEYLGQIGEMQTTFSRAGAPMSNNEEISMMAHRLKSSSLAVGAHQIADCLKLLEVAARNQAAEFNALFTATRLLITPTRNEILIEINRLAEVIKNTRQPQ